MFEIIKEYPNMQGKLLDVISLPSVDWIYADGEPVEEDYFRDFPDYFKEL